MKWNADDLTLLRTCFHNGTPASDTGKMLGRSRSAVIGKWHREKLFRYGGDFNQPTVTKANAIAKAKRAARTHNAAGLRLKPKPDIAPQTDFETADKATVGRPLRDLDDHQCRWPVASNGSSHLMCGEPGQPWCREHYKIVYKGQ